MNTAIKFARFSVFVIFFWFGLLKFMDLSPASPLVSDLLEKTLSFLTFEQFIIGFSVFEMFIGILFLFPKYTKLAVGLFTLHMIMALAPLVLLPAVTWTDSFVPTLEGQYIIKNLVLMAVVYIIYQDRRF